MGTAIKASDAAGGAWHEHPVRVRYAETDQMGVVHHSNYLLYMEEGRTALMNELGVSYAELEATGYGLPVRRAELRYRAPAVFDQELLVCTRPGRVRGASVSFEYEIRDRESGRLLAEGSTELACIRLSSPEREPCLLPPEIRSRFGGA